VENLLDKDNQTPLHLLHLHGGVLLSNSLYFLLNTILTFVQSILFYSKQSTIHHNSDIPTHLPLNPSPTFVPC
jgi:hypothetical protein